MTNVNEFNAQSNESILRPYNEEELAQHQIDLNFIPQYDMLEMQNNNIITSALSKLEELGLTQEEAKYITGV